ncbi:conserved hypothetical protein [uncultured Eubacteriales bacterium]|uniref:Uncharacterized protein n=1 Tax=uncultured Eubacteriales bacterium TaxID=172733 RepID=A0A212KEF0_9FIRM|nr:conserved hypothetical protein [uncultured Eubacteriales bacterium]
MKKSENMNTGFYEETMPLVLSNGENVRTVYRDTAVTMSDTECFTERKMVVDGKNFYVKSIFPMIPKSTPTKELLALVDSEKDMKK